MPRLALATAIGLIVGYLVFVVVIVAVSRSYGINSLFGVAMLGVVGLFCIGAVVALSLSLSAVAVNSRSIRAWVALLLSIGEVITMIVMVYRIYHVRF